MPKWEMSESTILLTVKDACDQVLAYTTGLYRLVQQILTSNPFYIPAGVVSYNLPPNFILNETNIDNYIEFINEDARAKNQLIVFEGQHVLFKSVDLCCDNKNYIQALEVIYGDRKMAIKINPPNTVCKPTTVLQYKDLPTLVLDFTKDAEKIQAMDSKKFQEYLLCEKLNKRWIYNPRIKEAYPKIFDHSQQAYTEKLEQEKLYKKEQNAACIQLLPQPKIQNYFYKEQIWEKSARQKKSGAQDMLK